MKLGEPLWSGNSAEPYLLESSVDQKEIMLLRAGDTISFPNRPDLGVTLALQLIRSAGEVQVDSSVAAAATSVSEVQKDHHGEDNSATSGDASETEDEDLDRIDAVPATGSRGARSQNTPAPAVSRSPVIQETPTFNRINAIEANDNSDGATAAPETENELQADITDISPSLRDTIEATPTASRDRPDYLPQMTESLEDTSCALWKPSIGDIVVSKEHDDESPIDHSKARADHVLESAQPTPSDAKPSSACTTDTSKFEHIETKRASRALPMVVAKEAKGGLKRKSSAALDTATPIRAKRSKSVPDAPMANPPSTVKKAPSRETPQSKKTNPPKDRSEQGTLSSSARSSSTPSPEDIWQGEPPKVAFSNSAIPSMVMMMKFLRQHGGSAVDTVQKGKCDLLWYVCNSTLVEFNNLTLFSVREGPLRKSMKLLSSFALGIPIVTDKWLIDSARKKQFLKPDAYVPKAPNQEREWGFSLGEIWGKPQSEIFHGKTVNFTPSLRRSYDDFKEVEALCRLLGARKVDTRAASKSKKQDDVVFLALEPSRGKDPDRTELLKQGCTVYSRDLLTSSILRGKLELDIDEFRLKG